MQFTFADMIKNDETTFPSAYKLTNERSLVNKIAIIGINISSNARFLRCLATNS